MEVTTLNQPWLWNVIASYSITQKNTTTLDPYIIFCFPSLPLSIGARDNSMQNYEITLILVSAALPN